MTTIKAFTSDQIGKATSLAHMDYLKEHKRSSGLLEIAHSVIHESLVPMIGSPFAFTVYENGRMTGFMAGDPATGSVPLFGHGSDTENAYALYSRMYELLAERLVENGITEHSVTLYRHDAQPLESFFHNGFGMSKVYAVCDLEKTDTTSIASPSNLELEAVGTDAITRLIGMKNKLAEHLEKSPSFIKADPITADAWRQSIKTEKRSVLSLVSEGKDIGFIEWIPSKATVISAYLEPSWRGRGLFNILLYKTFEELKASGHRGCKVVFDSMNPPSTTFWLKHFTPYAYELRRKL